MSFWGDIRRAMQQVIGQREVVLTVEVFTDSTVSSNDTGDDALAVVDRIRTMFVFDTIRDPPAALGISFLDLSEAAPYIPKIVSTGFRGRCVWPIRCLVTAPPLTQRTTWIQHVTGEVQPSGGALPIPPVPFDAP